jgi:hypothetical protein
VEAARVLECLDAAAARLGEDLDDHTQRMRRNRLVDGHGHCA